MVPIEHGFRTTLTKKPPLFIIFMQGAPIKFNGGRGDGMHFLKGNVYRVNCLRLVGLKPGE